MPGATPRVRIEAACQTIGRGEVVRRCVDILAGGSAEPPEFVIALGGQPAYRLLANGGAATDDSQAYWLRVWAARGLLWAGLGEEAPVHEVIDVLLAALDDDAWRVREMVCKVAARHCIDDLLERVVELEADPVARVRVAASRATRTMLAAAN